MSRSIGTMATLVGVCMAILIATRVARMDDGGSTGVDREAPALASPVDLDADVAACGKCGDGYCNPRCGENATNCPRDCGGTTSVAAACGKCGDGYCNPRCGENATSCPRDCGATTAVDTGAWPL